MQINRLFEIVYLLLERKSITAKELAEKFEVSTRTIYRDIEILSSSNIPIYTTQGNGGGICLLDEYVFNKSLLSEEEQNQILFALQSLEKLTNQEEKTILAKMSTLFQKKQNNWIEIDFSDWGTKGETDHTFTLIKEAILSKTICEFTYYNSYGQKNKRKIEPLQIYFKDKAWYLKAYCEEKQDYRLFKIARIRDFELTNEHFERQLPTKQQKKVEVKTITLTLEISQEMAFRVFDEFKPEDIIKQENGNFLVKVTYPESDWIYGYLLSFGEYLKVQAPTKVQAIVQEKLKKSLARYQT